jgi:hypothetical protein
MTKIAKRRQERKVSWLSQSVKPRLSANGKRSSANTRRSGKNCSAPPRPMRLKVVLLQPGRQEAKAREGEGVTVSHPVVTISHPQEGEIKRGSFMILNTQSSQIPRISRKRRLQTVDRKLQTKGN